MDSKMCKICIQIYTLLTEKNSAAVCLMNLIIFDASNTCCVLLAYKTQCMHLYFKLPDILHSVQKF